MNRTLITVIVIAAFAGLIVGLIIPSALNKPSSPPVATLSTRSPGDTGGTAGEKVAEVKLSPEAEKILAESDFDCACGTCEIKLEDCTCDAPKGSVEMKRFIEDKVREGKSKQQIVELVEKKYGI